MFEKTSLEMTGARADRRRVRPALLGLALAAGAFAALSTPASAQTKTGDQVWGEGGCAACHGNLAAGGEDPSYPAGPNLRRTRLDHAALVEVIACGRPGTQMPTNLAGAWTEHACYGQPLGPIPPDIVGSGFLTEEEITTLVDFLVEDVVGQTRITKENCAVFFGGDQNAIACREY